MKNPQRIQYILDEMQELFGDYPTTELVYHTPFQCLIAVMMSAQTTDKQVNKVTDELFVDIQGPQDILDIGGDALGERIRTIGLRKSKAKNIMKTAKLLVAMSEEWGTSTDRTTPTTTSQVYASSAEVYAHHGYLIPDTIEEMVTLPGVGIKTAKVVLYVLYRQRRVAVDTHVHRVMNRLAVVDTKTPEQTSRQLETIIPDDYKDIAHHTIIYFGRYLCTARNPACEKCPLTHLCKRYAEHKKRKGE